MLRHPSAATTRGVGVRPVRASFDWPKLLLAPSDVIVSPETQLQYRIERLLKGHRITLLNETQFWRLASRR